MWCSSFSASFRSRWLWVTPDAAFVKRWERLALFPRYRLEEASTGRRCIAQGTALQRAKQGIGFWTLNYIILIAQALHGPPQTSLWAGVPERSHWAHNDIVQILLFSEDAHFEIRWCQHCVADLLEFEADVSSIRISSQAAPFDGLTGSSFWRSPGTSTREELTGLALQINTCFSIARTEPSSWQLWMVFLTHRTSSGTLVPYLQMPLGYFKPVVATALSMERQRNVF